MKADLGIRAGDLVTSTAYKGIVGVVVEINVQRKGTPVTVSWTGHNRWGFGNLSVHHPDMLEVVSRG